MICVLHSHANRGAHADNQIRRSAGWQRKAYRPHVPDSSMGVPSAAAAAPAALAPSTMLPPPSVSIGCARYGIEHAESVKNRRCRGSTIGEERCIDAGVYVSREHCTSINTKALHLLTVNHTCVIGGGTGLAVRGAGIAGGPLSVRGFFFLPKSSTVLRQTTPAMTSVTPTTSDTPHAIHSAELQ